MRIKERILKFCKVLIACMITLYMIFSCVVLTEIHTSFQADHKWNNPDDNKTHYQTKLDLLGIDYLILSLYEITEN